MHEHAIHEGKMYEFVSCEQGETNAQVYMHAMNQNPNSDTNKAAKIDSNQGIQEHKSKNQNLH